MAVRKYRFEVGVEREYANPKEHGVDGDEVLSCLEDQNYFPRDEFAVTVTPLDGSYLARIAHLEGIVRQAAEELAGYDANPTDPSNIDLVKDLLEVIRAEAEN